MTSQAVVLTTPAIHDPRELNTIISTSLRSMFGDCQSYEIGLTVVECRPCSTTTATATRRRRRQEEDYSSDSYEAIIQCPTESLPYVRAALTLSMPPTYLQENLYRFDFLEINHRSLE